jgi:hypothetical protein
MYICYKQAAGNVEECRPAPYLPLKILTYAQFYMYTSTELNTFHAKINLLNGKLQYYCNIICYCL